MRERCGVSRCGSAYALPPPRPFLLYSPALSQGPRAVCLASQHLPASRVLPTHLPLCFPSALLLGSALNGGLPTMPCCCWVHGSATVPCCSHSPSGHREREGFIQHSDAVKNRIGCGLVFSSLVPGPGAHSSLCAGFEALWMLCQLAIAGEQPAEML